MQEAFFLLCLPTALPEGMAVSDWSSHTLTLKNHTQYSLLLLTETNPQINPGQSTNKLSLHKCTVLSLAYGSLTTSLTFSFILVLFHTRQ